MRYTPMNGSKYALWMKKQIKFIDQNISWQSDFTSLYLYCYCCNTEIWR